MGLKAGTGGRAHGFDYAPQSARRPSLDETLWWDKRAACCSVSGGTAVV